MYFEISTKEGNKVTLRTELLLEILSNEIVKNNKPELEVLTVEFRKYLQDKDTLGALTIDELLYLGIRLGYYYKVFMSKNTVEIKELTDERDITQSCTGPTCTGSCNSCSE